MSHPLSITFDPDASDTCHRILRTLTGLCVEVTPRLGAAFTAELVGVDPCNASCEALLVRNWDAVVGEGTGEPFSVTVKDVYVD